MDLPLYLKNRMANRQLSHAYLVVGENRRELAQTLAAAWVCTGDKPPCGHELAEPPGQQPRRKNDDARAVAERPPRASTPTSSGPTPTGTG